jgi:hypothetical protein
MKNDGVRDWSKKGAGNYNHSLQELRKTGRLGAAYPQLQLKGGNRMGL